MRIVLLGSPGAGKGVQAGMLSAELGIPHLSTGNILRSNIEAETELGQTAQDYVASGQYLPDELTNELVKRELEDRSARSGYILDGYPRTVPQATYLDEFLAQESSHLDYVINLEVSDEAVLRRLRSRGRADDTDDVVRDRLSVYRQQSGALLAYYADRVSSIWADGEPAEVQGALLETLANRR